MTLGASPPAQHPQALTQGEPLQADRAMAVATLRRRVKGGADSFYFVAALSVINSVLSAIGYNLIFVFGLSITQIIDGVATALGESRPDRGLLSKVGAVVVSVIISGFFTVLGFVGGQGRRWAFIVGMVLYFLDGVLMLAALLWVGTGQVQDCIGFAIHFYFLWGLWRGLRAANQLQKLVVAQTPIGSGFDFPKDIGYRNFGRPTGRSFRYTAGSYARE